MARTDIPAWTATVGISAQIKSVEREIGLRRSVYPHLIQTSKLTAVQAGYEIAAMEAVLATLRDLGR